MELARLLSTSGNDMCERKRDIEGERNIGGMAHSWQIPETIPSKHTYRFCNLKIQQKQSNNSPFIYKINNKYVVFYTLYYANVQGRDTCLQLTMRKISDHKISQNIEISLY